MHRTAPSAVLALFLAGCSATAGIETLGGGQYLVTGHGAFGSYGIANERAEGRAKAFCHAQDRSMQVVDLSHDQDPLGVYARLTFECS